MSRAETYDSGATDTELTWRDRARCAGMDPAVFFPRPNSHGVQRAFNVCYRCPVHVECLSYALTHSDGDYGIWGATTGSERRKLRGRKWVAR